MKDTRRARLWTLLGVVVLAATAGVGAARRARRAPAPAPFAAETDLRDAVAAPLPVAGMAGKTSGTVWFKAPSSRRAELDDALYASRRRRGVARRVSVQ